MTFNNIFNSPDEVVPPSSPGAGDRRSGMVYLFDQHMELAISAAAATQRPLLVTGPPGCGKSSLARNTANRLQRRYLERTVNSRTEINSLLWEVDHLRRLQDAQAQTLNEQLMAYVRPAVLWKAMDTQSAEKPLSLLDSQADTHAPVAPPGPAVVLVDEIDKADPDLPNNLLEVLGSLRFEVADTGHHVTCKDGIPLIIITSNDERDLPPAFVRRCICLKLKQPDLRQVALLHFPESQQTIDAALELIPENQSQSTRASEPSVAEFLDLIQACSELAIDPSSDAWKNLADLCLLKGHTRGASSRVPGTPSTA